MWVQKKTKNKKTDIPGKISMERKQPYEASIDLRLVVLRGPTWSIIDPAAIIQGPAWNKENISSQRKHPSLRAQYEKIIPLKPVNWKEKKGEEG